MGLESVFNLKITQQEIEPEKIEQLNDFADNHQTNCTDEYCGLSWSPTGKKKEAESN